MRDRELSLTAAQRQRVLEELGTMPAGPVGEHLADDAAIGYATDTLAADAERQVEHHLESCPECAARMERLLEADTFWSSPAGRQRLTALRERLLRSTPER